MDQIAHEINQSFYTNGIYNNNEQLNNMIYDIRAFNLALSFFEKSCTLAPTNGRVDGLSNDAMIMLKTREFTSYAHDELSQNCDPVAMKPIIRGFSYNNMLQSAIKMKIGCPLILARNLLPAAGLVNGLRVVLVRLSQKLLHCLIVTDKHKGKVVVISKTKFKKRQANNDCPYEFVRTQFSVRACFSMTINKSQGQTFRGKVAIMLDPPVFAHGQLYVALSRLSTFRNAVIMVKSLPTDFEQTSQLITKNVVFLKWQGLSMKRSIYSDQDNESV